MLWILGEPVPSLPSGHLGLLHASHREALQTPVWVCVWTRVRGGAVPRGERSQETLGVISTSSHRTDDRGCLHSLGSSHVMLPAPTPKHPRGLPGGISLLFTSKGSWLENTSCTRHLLSLPLSLFSVTCLYLNLGLGVPKQRQCAHGSISDVS